MVFQEADLSVRVLRDVFLNEFEKAIIDSEKQFERVTNFFQRTAPELVDEVELYTARRSRCSRNGGSTRRSSRPSTAASTCPPAAT